MNIDELQQRAADFLAAHNAATTDRLEFLRARFDAGLAWVHYPDGYGGLGLEQSLQPEVDRLFDEAGAPTNRPEGIAIGLGMAAPTILAYGTEKQKESCNCRAPSQIRGSPTRCSNTASTTPAPSSADLPVTHPQILDFGAAGLGSSGPKRRRPSTRCCASDVAGTGPR